MLVLTGGLLQNWEPLGLLRPSVGCSCSSVASPTCPRSSPKLQHTGHGEVHAWQLILAVPTTLCSLRLVAEPILVDSTLFDRACNQAHAAKAAGGNRTVRQRRQR